MASRHGRSAAWRPRPSRWTGRSNLVPGAKSGSTPLELFFDLVFVLSFTQVTSSVVHHGDWAGLGEGILILAAVWWAWAAYGWLTNTIDPDENVNRLCMFAAMGGMVVVSLSIPEAFGDRGLLFGCAYFFVRAMQLDPLRAEHPAARATPYNLEAILKLAPGLLLGLRAADRRRGAGRRGAHVGVDPGDPDRLVDAAALRQRASSACTRATSPSATG